MILKASKRGGARHLARHLMNGEKNEHVTVHEVSGFASDNVSTALDEIHAISKGTKCSRFMFSLSLSPPQNENVPVSVFENTLKQIEQKLGLKNQPRVIVFHEKHGRRHAHCVWSRINASEMKAIDQPYFKNRLMEISKSLYIRYGWDLPKGFIDKNNKNPLNYTRQEWQQAARTGQNPKAIKSALQECWAVSDNKKSFEQALKMRGYYLSRGDRRGFVVVDIHGEVYSLTRQLGLKKKGIEQKIGKANKLPSVDTVKKKIEAQVSGVLKKFIAEQSKGHQKTLLPLLKTKHAMTKQHRLDRAAQKSYQDNRWKKEELKRVSKIRKGFKGLWDKLNGKYWKQRKANEFDTTLAHERDQSEQHTLIQKQLVMRQNLQARLNSLRLNHEKQRQTLIRDLTRNTSSKDKGKDLSHLKNIKSPAANQRPTPKHGEDKDHDSGFDIEPEL